MKERLFRFKQFSVAHSASAMKVGVDGVLLGAWTEVRPGDRRLLDVGCGCGLIALMLAQRCPSARIAALDVDEPSVKEAQSNFNASPWAERLEAFRGDFADPEVRSNLSAPFDLIVSNPPFFDSGIIEPETPRLLARHADALNPLTLLELGVLMLAPQGRIALISPPEWLDALRSNAVGMRLQRLTYVSGREGKEPKRILTQWSASDADRPTAEIATSLSLELSPGVPSEEHRRRCAPFYLKF